MFPDYPGALRQWLSIWNACKFCA